MPLIIKLKFYNPTVFKKITSFKYIKNKIYNRIYHGLNFIDAELENYLPYDGGFFVELGANDGINQSNTYFFEKYRGWHGVLVEPAPNNYLECVKNRSNSNFIYCNACVSFGYSDKYVDMLFANLMSCSVDLESDNSDSYLHARKGEIYLEKNQKVFSFGAIARPLNEILIESGAPKRINLLSLDVEGAEIEVLKGINHDYFRFDFICIESRNFDKIKYYLGQKKYSFVKKLGVQDYLFKAAL